MKKNPRNTKIIIGISGGVDSSVAALLLKQQGYDVHGVFMQNWEADQNDPYCSIVQDLHDAKAVCQKLHIPFTTMNFAKEYWDRVFQYFLDEYSAGRTPNPDVLCNKEIKFRAFLDYALEQQADFIATGHYVRKDIKNSKYRLLKGLDNNKDQSYFLYALNQKQLAHSLFPVGELQKSEVRAIAKRAGFANYAKKDSTGICFIGERRFKNFLSEYLLAKPGDIITMDNKVVGRHDGLMFYTLGQRKGLKIGGRKDAPEAAWYVAAKDIANNTLIVVQSHDHPLLLSNSLDCKELHWISGIEPDMPYSCTAKIRYRVQDQECTILKCHSRESGNLDPRFHGDDSIRHVEFIKPQWAITPGQSVVFYQGEECLGGGIILKST